MMQSPATVGFEPPTECHSCASPNVSLIKLEEPLNPWPFIWACGDCAASVGCHPNTNRPFGFMASRHVRRLRTEAHLAFDQIWRERFMSREKAYRWLAAALNIEIEAAHISWLSATQLRKTVEVSTEYLTENRERLLKRKEKQYDKRTKRYAREGKQGGLAIARRKARPKH